MTFSEFVTAVSRQVFPQGEAPNLRASHKNWIKDALIKIQQRVLCQQFKQYDYLIQGSTFWNCGATVFEAPRGFIQSVKTISTANQCDEVHYRPTTKDELECLIREAESQASGCDCPTSQPEPYQYCPPYATYGYLLGMRYANETNDQECRTRCGSVAMHDGFLWMFPAMRSDEITVVEWKGVKREWNDIDLVTYDREVQEAVENFLELKVAGKEDCDIQKYGLSSSQFDDKIADLIWQCKKERRLPQAPPCFLNCNVRYCCSGKPVPFDACTGTGSANYFYGADDPNGVQTPNAIGDLYIQVTSEGQAVQWINIDGTISGWI